MSRRIRVDVGTHTRETNDLSRQLKAIRTNYVNDLMSRKRAVAKAKQVIYRQFDVLLRLSRDRIRHVIGRRLVNLPPEELARLEKWRDDYLADFEKILDDARRGLGKRVLVHA